MADWLQYGALGLLALVLVAVGAGIREVLSRWQEREKAALNHQAQADRDEATLAAQRMEAQDTFLRDLIEKDRQERAQQLEAWQELVAQDIKAIQAQTVVIDALCQHSEEHERRAAERHQGMMVFLQQQRKDLP